MSIPRKEDLFHLENALYNKGFQKIAGIDEAGRGPLAGPVVSACVVFIPGFYIEGVRDSKTISENKREKLYELIRGNAVSYGIGVVNNQDIDRMNIRQASIVSMLLALDNLSVWPDYVLTDAVPLELDIPSEAIIKGDAKSFTIAAASILAKVTRDRMMLDYHREYPHYGWDRNKGYPTREHREAVLQHGYSPYHRRSFTVRV